MHAPFISIAFVNPTAGTGPRERAKGVGPRGEKGKGERVYKKRFWGKL